MEKFKLWRPELFELEEDAEVVTAESAKDAAETFALDDADGETDGIYRGDGLLFMVADASGNVTRVRVVARVMLQYTAEVIEP